jgi:hypothetical protein
MSSAPLLPAFAVEAWVVAAMPARNPEEAKMTEKRDLKRRVRDRQARTGESYMTALRQVQAQRPPTFPVVELMDLTEIGTPLGFKCRIAMFPGLADRIDVATALAKLRDVLLMTDRDRSLELFRAVALRGEPRRFRITQDTLDEGRRFVMRARAGLSSVSDGGRMLTLNMEGKQGAMMVICLLWLVPDFVHVLREPSLILTSLDAIAVDPILAWEEEAR